MKPGRTILSSLVALSLTACGGGGSGGSAPGGGTGGTGGGTGGGGTGSGCSLAERQQFARDTINEWYLFPDKLNLNANPASFADVQSYIDALVAPSVAPAGGPLQHEGLTYITSIKEEQALMSGSNAGFGIRLSYDTTANKVFVLEAYETAPGFAAGMDRGTEITSIDGKSVASLMASGGSGAVSDALGPTTAGLTRTLGFTTVEGVSKTVAITKAEYSLDPVSDRYGVQVLDDGTGEKVGYVNLRTFIVANADTQLRNAFAQFRAAGITKIILDFRYNGGGLVSVAKTLGSLLQADKAGQVFSRTILRPSKAGENTNDLFTSLPQAITATKVAVIGRSGTASASELVANSLIPYLGDNLALIGANTYGKPVGQYAFDKTACDDRLRVIAFKTVNRDGNGEYYNGLASVMPRTCTAGDDLTRQMGNPQEASTKIALDFLAGRSCTAIGSGTGVKAQGGVDRFPLLRPRQPNAAQRDNPALY